MSYTFLLERGEESSVESFSDIPASVLSRSNPTVERSCSSDSETASYLAFPSGTTCEPSTAPLGAGALTCSVPDSPARTFRRRDRAVGSTESEAAFGRKCPESFARYDPVARSWRTHQYSLLGALTEFSGTWPNWGTMRDGECFPLTMRGYPTSGSEPGLLPTPCASEFRDISRAEVLARLDKGGRVARRLCSTHLRQSPEIVGLNPCFAEWMCGWPMGWTDCTPLATARFQAWLRSHGGS